MHFHNSTTFEAMCCRYILNNVRTEPSLFTLPPKTGQTPDSITTAPSGGRRAGLQDAKTSQRWI